MAHRLCGFDDTITGAPCENWVAPHVDHCAAGHPCAPVAVAPGVSFASFGDPGAPFELDDLAHVGAAPAALEARARALGVDLGPTFDHSADADDIEWSSNEWCLSMTAQISAADVLLERPSPQGTEVLLIQRAHPPFGNVWALPGGMRDEGETLAETADREMGEEVGLHVGAGGEWAQRDLGEETATDWDTRFPSVHVGASFYRVPADTRAKAQDDAREAHWVPLAGVAAGEYPLAFGHAEWFKRAYRGDAELGAKFRLLRDAGRVRNRRLITQINEVRRVRGAPLIDLEAPVRLAS
jgi:8-oxo-dGTP diphosphatase